MWDVINEYLKLFIEQDDIYEIALGLYQAMYQQCEISDEYKICQIIDKQVLNKLYRSAKRSKEKKEALLYKKFFALSARRNLRNFAYYIESGKKKKIWQKTMVTMESVFFYGDKWVNEELELLRVSCMPGLGKSYFGNLIVANLIGNDPNSTILRITFSDDLVKTTTKQTLAIMQSKEFKEIFPRYKVEKMFKSETNYTFAVYDCEDEYNLFSVTRDGQATGKRAKYVIIDDLIKGQLEMNNALLMKALVDRYDSDWSSRADDDNQKTLLLGTMWSDKDLLNVLLERAEQYDVLQDDPYHKYTRINRKGAFIGIPALDPLTDNSTCKQRFSNTYLRRKRNEMTKVIWSAVYMQNPIAPEGIEFDYSNLLTYSTSPETYNAVYASLDPARKGKNYVSMPICVRVNDDHYLVDFMYQKKSMLELYDVIIDKIIEWKVNILLVENNTDTSLKVVLDTKLKEKGYFGCVIKEKYSVVNKEQRIKDMQGLIRGHIYFPEKGKFPINTDMGQALESITSFSFDRPNKFDDGIDSISLYADEFVNEKKKFNKIKFYPRQLLGI